VHNILKLKLHYFHLLEQIHSSSDLYWLDLDSDL